LVFFGVKPFNINFSESYKAPNLVLEALAVSHEIIKDHDGLKERICEAPRGLGPPVICHRKLCHVENLNRDVDNGSN
jgi:hypothetical protein